MLIGCVLATIVSAGCTYFLKIWVYIYKLMNDIENEIVLKTFIQKVSERIKSWIWLLLLLKFLIK